MQTVAVPALVINEKVVSYGKQLSTKDIIKIIEKVEINMKPFIIKERCAAQPDVCPPMKACKNGAFSYVEDEDEPIGGRIEIDYEKCSGCGDCVDICCGNCIEMRD